MQITFVQSSEDFLSFIRDQAMPNGNLSIRGVARCCGVYDNKSLISGGDFKSQKLGEKLISQGFTVEDLVENGFPPQAVWFCIEYFAYDSKAKAEQAKQLARTFGSIGILTTLEKLKAPIVETPVQPQKPVRDTIDWIEAKKYLDKCTDPIFKSAAMQMLYEDIGAKVLMPSEERHVPIAVLAREMGYTLKPNQDAQLGKFAKKNLEPTGCAPHGRYQVNTYLDSNRTREVISAFFA